MSEQEILIRHGGGAWTSPPVASYEDERHLRDLILASPSRVPGVAEGSFAVKEMHTSGGFIDVCIVGLEGDITVVECKLASNSEKRRMVVGQVIDYAAAIWHDGLESFRGAWSRAGGPDLGEVLEPAAYDHLRDNLATVRINLCLAVDRIDADMRRLIEYLNLATLNDVSVTAIQLVYARDGDVEILVPSVYGAEIATAKQPAADRSKRWTWDTFLAELGDPDVRLAQELHERLLALPKQGPSEPLWFGRRPSGGVFFHLYGLRYAPFQLWRNAAGQLNVFGHWKQWPAIKGHPGFAQLAEILGQDMDQRQQAVSLSSLDLDEFWQAAKRCAVTINSAARPSSEPEAKQC